jgi:two-component system, cell cycle sensor histidine kinase and response regulator CckA
LEERVQLGVIERRGETGMNPSKILVVEDEPITAKDVKEHLERLGYSVCGAVPTGRAAITCAEVAKPDLAVIDIRLKGKQDGIEVARTLRDLYGIPTVFLTAYKDQETLERAKLAEPVGYLLKPFSEQSLRLTIDLGLHKHATEERVRNAKQWFSTTLSCIRDAIFAFDSSERLSFANAAAEQLIGLPSRSVVGLPSDEVFSLLDHSSDKTRVLDLAAYYKEVTSHGDGEPREFLLRLPHKSESIGEAWFEVTGSLIEDHRQRSLGSVFVVRDIEHRKKIEREKILFEERLHQAQKMDALGKLASGVAHDFNNLLAGILGNINLLKTSCSPQFLELLDATEQDVARAAELAGKLLSASGGSLGRQSIVSVSSVVKECVNVASASFAPGTALRFHMSSSNLSVIGDAHQLHQIVFNILINARDAINEKTKSITKHLVEASGDTYIKVSIDEVSLDPNEVGHARPSKDGRYVAIRVSDSGIGMSSEVRNRMFEPFFSTKGVSRGSGLGLYVVYGLVKKLGGWIDTQTAPFEGTEVSVYLPCATQNSPASSATHQDKKSILVVGEELLTRDLAAAMGEQIGFRTLTAQSSLEACELIRRQSEDLALIVVDTASKLIDRLSLERELRRSGSRAKVIEIVSLSQKENTETPSLSHSLTLPKPFRLQDFTLVTQQALAS